MNHRPVVLCFSGHDPCGGAGIQADIEVISSHGCHAATIITCLTQQDTHNVVTIWPQDAPQFTAQALTLINDLNIAVIKIGLIGSAEIAVSITDIIKKLPNIPVVFDPVLAAGGGRDMSNHALRKAIINQLLPYVSLITPNSHEARLLTGKTVLSDCAATLQAMGADYVLITGSHENTATVDNSLFMPDQKSQTFHWQRLSAEYHGSGCTLASACAALMARGLDIYTAVTEAQDFTWQSLEAAYKTGSGQLNPNRMFWCES